jgi:pimeloyl-ACP methyl ester carboxylesterase
MNPQRSKAVDPIHLLKLLVLVCLPVYLAVCGLVALFQRSLIYYPTVRACGEVEQMAPIAGLERWTNAAGEFIGMKRDCRKQPAEGAVLIMYGNGSTAIGAGHYAHEIQAVAAFDIYILEYPGYEDRPGRPSQRSLFSAARQAIESLPANKPVFLVGESLGGGVASYLAGTCSNKIAGLLLISPFNSMTAVAQNHFRLLPVWLLLKDRYASDYYLRNYRGRVGMTVDGNDTVVPERFSLRLFEGYAGPKRLWKFPTGGHCQIIEQPSKFWREVVGFWQGESAGPSIHG